MTLHVCNISVTHCQLVNNNMEITPLNYSSFPVTIYINKFQIIKFVREVENTQSFLLLP